MNPTFNSINKFFNTNNIAISGVSRDKNKFGYLVFKKLSETGKKIYPINPNTEIIDDCKCYQLISDIPENVEHLVILNNKNRVLEVLESAKYTMIKNIWIQKGSESGEVLNYLKNNYSDYITHECIFMWTEPVKGVHKFHKKIRRFFGKLPK
ncbi:MAG: CoA-binding protein [Bacteroidota bacterium]